MSFFRCKSCQLVQVLSRSLSRMYQTVKLLYCFGIFITFALQFYVPAEILIPPAVDRVSDSWKKPVDLLLRTLLVIFTCECCQTDSRTFPAGLHRFTLPNTIAWCWLKHGAPRSHATRAAAYMQHLFDRILLTGATSHNPARVLILAGAIGCHGGSCVEEFHT